MDCGTVAILATVATCERRFKYNASGKRRGGPRRAPTARAAQASLVDSQSWIFVGALNPQEGLDVDEIARTPVR